MPAADIRARMAADGAEEVRAVEVPKWGTVYVRDMTAGESDRWVAKSKELGDLGDVDPSAFAAAMIICDETGQRIFDPLNADDLAFLSKRRKLDLNRILTVGDSSGN
jgi:hypothetical protein